MSLKLTYQSDFLTAGKGDAYEKSDHYFFKAQEKKSGSQKICYNYYPFGLQTANSWTRDNAQANNFLGNGGTELNTTTQVYDLDYRNYDPILGRMNQVDPMADQYGSINPYNFAFNDPVYWNDVDGANPKRDPSEQAEYEWYQQRARHIAPNGLRMWTPSGSWVPGFTGLEDGSWDDMVGNYDLSGSGFGFGDLYSNPSTVADAVAGEEHARNSVSLVVPDHWVYDKTVYRDVPIPGVINSMDMYHMEFREMEMGTTSVGEPGVWEGMIPIWGSGRSAIDNFQNGNYWSGAGYTALAISDVFLVKSIATGVAKGGVQLLGKNYKYWNTTRQFLGKTGFADAGQQVHHWALARNGAIKGEGVAWWAKNQMWNLMPMESAVFHQSIHGIGPRPFGPLKQFWFGTPTWFKSGLVSGGGRAIDLNDDEDE